MTSGPPICSPWVLHCCVFISLIKGGEKLCHRLRGFCNLQRPSHSSPLSTWVRLGTRACPWRCGSSSLPTHTLHPPCPALLELQGKRPFHRQFPQREAQRYFYPISLPNCLQFERFRLFPTHLKYILNILIQRSHLCHLTQRQKQRGPSSATTANTADSRFKSGACLHVTSGASDGVSVEITAHSGGHTHKSPLYF